jgi:hypothetical protein
MAWGATTASETAAAIALGREGGVKTLDLRAAWRLAMVLGLVIVCFPLLYVSIQVFSFTAYSFQLGET